MRNRDQRQAARELRHLDRQQRRALEDEADYWARVNRGLDAEEAAAERAQKRRSR